MIASPLDLHRFHLSQMLKLTRATFEAHDVWQAAHDCLYPPQEKERTATKIRTWWESIGEGGPALPTPEAYTETATLPGDWFEIIKANTDRAIADVKKRREKSGFTNVTVVINPDIIEQVHVPQPGDTITSEYLYSLGVFIDIEYGRDVRNPHDILCTHSLLCHPTDKEFYLRVVAEQGEWKVGFDGFPRLQGNPSMTYVMDVPLGFTTTDSQPSYLDILNKARAAQGIAIAFFRAFDKGEKS